MLTAEELLDYEFLPTRCQLIEIAATLDRYQRAALQEGSAMPAVDPRLQLIADSLAILTKEQPQPNRAEQLLNLFSDLPE